MFVVVDGDFVKARLERAFREQNRTLVIEGTPRVRLFPVASLALARARLSQPGAAGTFLELDAGEVAVRVLPLLAGEIAIEKLRVAGLHLHLARARDGRANWSDFEAARQGRPEAGRWRLRLAELQVERGRVDYRDEATGQTLSVSGIELRTGRLDGEAPAPVTLSLQVSGGRPAVELQLQGKGALRLDPARVAYAAEDFALVAKGRLGAETIAAEFAAPWLAITPARAQGAEVKGAVQMRGPQRALDARLRLDGIGGASAALAIAEAALVVHGRFGATALEARLDTPLQADLRRGVWQVPRLAAQIAVSSPAFPRRTAALRLAGEGRIEPRRERATLSLTGTLDDSTLKASAAVTRFEPLAASFDCSVDRLDLDRYWNEPRAGSKRDDRLEFSLLEGKTLSGRFAADALTVRGVRLEEVRARLELAQGRLELAPHSARLYGGSLEGSLVAEVKGKRLELRETLRNVALGPLLRDLARKDLVAGRASATLAVQSTGATLSEHRKSLAGSARIEVRDGAVRGVDLVGAAERVRDLARSRRTAAGTVGGTELSELSASFTLRGGVAHNDDLEGVSPLLRLSGAGRLDIGANTIDYTLRATLLAPGQAAGAPGAAAGPAIPIRLTGTLDAPAWSVDYSALAAGAGGALGRAAGAAAEATRKGAASVGDSLRDLLRR